jgi:hypothetical protein
MGPGCKSHESLGFDAITDKSYLYDCFHNEVLKFVQLMK